MAPRFKVRVVEQCHISPPANTSPISLPLTFFDIPWLLFSPSQPLFFYALPFSTCQFTTTILPILKHSLSLTLQHFQPFSGNISTASPLSKPQIVYKNGDSVLLTIADAEFSATFHEFCSNHVCYVPEFLSLVPELLSGGSQNMPFLPSLAVQITIFRDTGMSIGLSFQHVVADERTFNMFMKSWASISKSLLLEEDKSLAPTVKSLPFFDRNVIIDPNGHLKNTLLSQLWNGYKNPKKYQTFDKYDIVRATFVLNVDDMGKIKRWIINQCSNKNQPQPILLSAYVLACAFVWVCMTKSRETKRLNVGQEPILYLGFIAGGIHRLDYGVPTTYFGNCVGFGRSGATKHELVGEDGVVVAAKAIGKTIKELDKEVLRDAKKWIYEWEELVASVVHVMVVGSPKVDLYEMDFGWGKPSKIEKILSDRVNVMSLTESRELKGGIEVGVVLSKADMDSFISLFSEGLNVMK